MSIYQKTKGKDTMSEQEKTREERYQVFEKYAEAIHLFERLKNLRPGEVIDLEGLITFRGLEGEQLEVSFKSGSKQIYNKPISETC